MFLSSYTSPNSPFNCGAQWLEHRTGDHGSWVRMLRIAVSELWQFRLTHFSSVFRRRLRVRAVGPLYLVSGGYARRSNISHAVPEGECVTCRGLHNSEINRVLVLDLAWLLRGHSSTCYVTLFFCKLDPDPPPRNANNIEHYNLHLRNAFFRKIGHPPPPPALRNT